MNIYVADESWERRITFRRLFAQISKSLRIIGEERLGSLAIPALERLHPDLIVLDYYIYRQYYTDFSKMAEPLLLVCDFPAEPDDAPVSGNVCGFLLTADISAKSLSRVLRRYFPYVFEQDAQNAFSVCRSKDDFLALPAEKETSDFGLFILSLPPRTFEFYAIEYLQREMTGLPPKVFLKLMEAGPDCVLMLWEISLSVPDLAAELMNRLDRANLPENSHYLVYRHLRGLPQLRVAMDHFDDALTRCFFAVARYIPLSLPFEPLHPVSESELDGKIRELQSRLYAKDQYGFFALLKDFYTQLATGGDIASCRAAHEMIRELWLRASVMPGVSESAPPLAFSEGNNLRELYENMSNHFVAFFSSNPEISHVTDCAVRFLMAHYAEPVALAETAEAVNVSGSYLSRRFRADTGFTVLEYLNKIRMDNACVMLTSQRNYKVSQIASECGFSDAHYFATRFKKVMGCSPLEYRKLRRGGERA